MESKHSDLRIRISTIKRGDRGRSKNKTISWGSLCHLLATPEQDNKYTLEQYLELSVDAQNKRKDVGSFVGGPFEGGIRKFNTLIQRSVVTLDIDSATPAQMRILKEKTSKVCKYEFFASTTRKHSKKKPRWRVVFPTTRPMTIEEYPAVSRILASKVFDTVAESMDAIDDVSFRPAQIMYWPSVCKYASFETIHNQGRLLNPDKILERFGDWQDWTLLPFSESRGNKRPAGGQKAEDPREKAGIIGAFCRAYDVPAAIEAYLPEKYIPGDENSAKPRYTYALGSSSNGAIVEDDGLFLYSHHGTDPCAERLVNAFDLVRIHLFGDLDNGAPADATATELPSFDEMRHLCREDENVQAEMVDDYMSDVTDSDFDDLDDDEEDQKPKKSKKKDKKSKKSDESEDRDSDYPEPDMRILRQSKHDAPMFPVDVLGSFWADKAREWAKMSAGPVDYTAMTLLVGAAAAIGNSRWVQAKPGWKEPPVLWCCLVGRPSTNKSPSMGQMTRIMSGLEASWIPLYKEQMREFESEKKAVEQRRKMWETKLQEAIENMESEDDDLPRIPKNCEPPLRPQPRRIVLNDVTLEKMMHTLSGNPRGLLNYRDELSGWFANLSRYSNGSDRPAWLEAYGGRPYTVDRVKFEDGPLHVRHFSVSILGGIQPERLMGLLNSEEDGLQARFMYCWPETSPKEFVFTDEADDSVDIAFKKLSDLSMEPDQYGNPEPVIVPLSQKAWKRFSKWALQRAQDEENDSPALGAAFGKANGLVLRIALALQYMWWSSDVFHDEEEPSKVGLQAINAAIRMREEYIKPMQIRVFSQVGITDLDRRTAVVARWIVDDRPKRLDVRSILRADLPHIQESKQASQIIDRLLLKNWLIPSDKPKTDAGGRPVRTFEVNKLIYSKVR